MKVDGRLGNSLIEKHGRPTTLRVDYYQFLTFGKGIINKHGKIGGIFCKKADEGRSLSSSSSALGFLPGLSHDVGRNKLHGNVYKQGNDDQVIDMANHRDKVGNQVKGQQKIENCRRDEYFRYLGDSLVF